MAAIDVSGLFAGFGSGFVEQGLLIGKVALYGIIAIVILLVLMWIMGFKDRIIIMKPTLSIDKGKLIRKKDGSKQYKLFKMHLFKNITVTPPPEEYATLSAKGKKVYCCIKKDIEQLHWLDMGKPFVDEKEIKVVPSNYFNWFIMRGKDRIARYKNPNTLAQMLLPVAVIVFIVMVSITFIYLFKEAPTAIAVDIVQNQCGQLIPSI